MMNAAISFVSLSLLVCCFCQEIIDKSYFSNGDRQSCCMNDNREREMNSKIQKLEHAISDLYEQLRNTELAHCVPGSYSNTGLVPCKLCEVGTYQPSTGSTSCKPCEVGSYQASVGSTFCTVCEVGSYEASSGSSSCTTCGEGLWTATTGSTADTDCIILHIGTDCGDFNGTTSGVYKIKPQGVKEPFSVYCDIQTEGEGWTVFQRRQDGSVDFYRDWTSYETGFGDLMGEFWLGNHYLYSLTSQGSYELRVNLSDFEGNTRYANYRVFSLGDASTNYTLAVSGYSGNAGDSLRDSNNWPFSTQDRDHDRWSSNCAVAHKGAWWYGACSRSNLNGKYHHQGEHITSDWDGVFWWHWKESGYYSLRSTTMSVRRRN
ncbi:hypothetical protein ScPMuIL_002301 [Solemya velum]